MDRPRPAATRHPACLLALLASVLIWVGSASAAEAENRRADDRQRPESTGLIYGGAIGINREIYTDYDRRVVPIPVIGYRGEKLQVLGPFISYELFRTASLGLEARVSPRFQGYDESDSDIFRGMEDRKSSLDYGLGLTWERGSWTFELATLKDLLDRSNGSEWSVDLSRAYRVGRVTIEPVIGASYLDRALVDYYYGVEASEAASFRPAYEGDNALNTRIGVTVSTPAFFGGYTRFGLERTWFDTPLADSPLTDTDSNIGLFVSFSKYFDR